MNNKIEFKKWLKSFYNLKYGSIKNYSSAVGGYSTKLAQRKNLIKKKESLLSISDPSKYNKIKADIESSADFIEKDIRARKMYSYGLQRYLEFLNIRK